MWIHKFTWVWHLAWSLECSKDSTIIRCLLLEDHRPCGSSWYIKRAKYIDAFNHWIKHSFNYPRNCSPHTCLKPQHNVSHLGPCSVTKVVKPLAPRLSISCYFDGHETPLEKALPIEQRRHMYCSLHLVCGIWSSAQGLITREFSATCEMFENCKESLTLVYARKLKNWT